MVALLCTLAYGLIAAASIIGLMIAAYRLGEDDCYVAFVACGVFWPVALLPAAAYLVAIWLIYIRGE